ncbi:MAG: hypothetical protein ACD_49C00026G0010 [uncultured bacterium (gcode 4)]|uniref:AAA+ ATPase domain-containing protein n=1 Tax=uncultured bacterium (gcode 4) TaxID=1234023 RepID=K2AFA4_9BACT|nr:MAG: hypothetical protein ACD_49C00026G0010 [uncultured bacterium (gcode 4)]
MNTLRKEQLLQSWLIKNRDNINDQVFTLNIDILQKLWREKIDSYLERKLKNISIEDLKVLQYKIEKFYWIIFDDKISFFGNLFSTIVNWVLLPDYIKNWEQPDIDKELDRILWNIIHKVDLIISENWFYGVNIWSEQSFINELKSLWFLYERGFKIWWNFGINHYYLNKEEWTYESFFNIALTKTERVEDDDPTIINLKKEKIADYGKIIKELTAYFWKPKNGKFTIADPDYKGFYILVEKFTDSWRTYWDYEDSYCAFTINNPELTNDINPELIKDLFIRMLDLNNLVINFIWDITNHENEKKFHSFSNNMMLYGEEFFKEVPDKKEEKLREKFKSLLVKIKTPVYFDEIGWQDNAKEELKWMIESFKYEQTMKSWATGSVPWLVLEWPPGTGKTLLAKAFATEIGNNLANVEVYNIKLNDILSGALINTWTNNIWDLFKFLRLKITKENKYLIIILEELDALFKKRGDRGNDKEDIKVVNSFLTELWWFEDLENVVFIGTTNNLEAIDKAVIRSWRMTLQIKIDLPDKKWIAEIFDIHINAAKKRTERKIFVDNIDISRLIPLCKWFSWADIKEIIRLTLHTKAREEIAWAPRDSLIVATQDIISAIQKFKTKGNKDKKEYGFGLN